MPPKKKINKGNQDPNTTEAQTQPASKIQPLPEPKKQQPKQDHQEPKVVSSLAIIQQIKPFQQIVHNQEKEIIEHKTEKIAKITIDDTLKLSEQERLKLRKLRYGTLGTNTTAEQAEKIKQERLKKFGGTTIEDQQQAIERRKQKFGNNPSLIVEDPQIAKKRLQKFGTTGISNLSEDKQTLQQRRKKFGNPQLNINLDDEITKSKQIKKFHPKFNNKKHFNKHHDNKFRR